MLLIAAAGCKKDIIGEEEINVLEPLPSVSVLSSVLGLVEDEAGSALEGVTVSLRDQEQVTDENGYFRFAEVKTSTLSGGYLSFKKTGYFDNYKFHYASEAGDQSFLRVAMLDKSEPQSFNAMQGGLITAVDNWQGEVYFPADVIADKNGNQYSGNVNVYAKWIDPVSSDLTEQMPGDLRAVNSSEELVQLSTFGMMAVELRDDTGGKLNIAAGKSATMKMTIPSELLESAPDSIPTWSFDEVSGYWLQEGYAVPTPSSPDVYSTEVTHFSYWNYDAPWPIIDWCATLTYEDGTPVANTEVFIRIVDSGVTKSSFTNTRGKVSGSLPKDQLLELILHSTACGGEYFSMEIGPYSEAQNISIVVPTPNNAENIKCIGTLSCDGQPVNNGYVIITNENFVTQVAPTNADGYYEIDILDCGLSKLTVQGFDLDSGMVADAETFEEPTNPLQVDQETCTGVVFEEYIDYTIDGEKYFIEDPIARILNEDLDFTGSKGLTNLCWDSNSNGIGDAGEDSDSNGVIDEFDCGSPEIRISVEDALMGINTTLSIIVTVNGITSWDANSGIEVTIDNLGTMAGQYVEGSFSGKMSTGPDSEDVEVTGEFKIRLKSIETRYSVSGFIWVDSNGNSQSEGDELGNISFASSVELIDENGNLEAMTTTDALGNYKFNNVDPGPYQIKIIKPALVEFVDANVGQNECSDSDIDPATGLSDVFIVTDDNISCIDAGFQDPGVFPCEVEILQSASTCSGSDGRVLIDFPNAPGQSTSIVVGGTVYDNPNGGDFTFSGPAGEYEYTVLSDSGTLCAGEFTIEESDEADICELFGLEYCENGIPIYESAEYWCPGLGSNYTFLWSDGSTEDFRTFDVSSTYTLTITDDNGCSGTAELAVDLSEHYQITGFVWEDNPIGEDGIYQAGEEKIGNIIVNLYEGNTNGTPRSTTTLQDGSYSFEITDRTQAYYISIELPNGYEYSPERVGSDNDVNSKIDPVTGTEEIEFSDCVIPNNIHIGIKPQ